MTRKEITKRIQFDLRMWIGLIGVVVAAIAALTLLGYFFDKPEFYRWNHDVGMALNTAIELFLVGIAFVWIALSERLWS